ncbi:hypothetical protein B0H14DRAFT_2852601, partial [Mycena olivaceomarginata]
GSVLQFPPTLAYASRHRAAILAVGGESHGSLARSCTSHVVAWRCPQEIVSPTVSSLPCGRLTSPRGRCPQIVSAAASSFARACLMSPRGDLHRRRVSRFPRSLAHFSRYRAAISTEEGQYRRFLARLRMFQLAVRRSPQRLVSALACSLVHAHLTSPRGDRLRA